MPIYKCIRFMVTFRCTKMCVRMWMCLKALIQHTFSFAEHCDCYQNLKFGIEVYLKNVIHMCKPSIAQKRRPLAIIHILNSTQVVLLTHSSGYITSTPNS